MDNMDYKKLADEAREFANGCNEMKVWSLYEALKRYAKAI